VENDNNSFKDDKSNLSSLKPTLNQNHLISLFNKKFSSMASIGMHSLQEDIQLNIEPKYINSICKVLKNSPDLSFNYLECITLVDYEKNLEVVYHLTSFKLKESIIIKSLISIDSPIIDSVVNIWRAADWFEREAHDLFGVNFSGHPNLKPLLLFEGFEGYPGRKSFPINDYQEW